MKETFGIYSTQELKELCMRLVNEGKSFSVTVVRTDDNSPHHWVVEY